MARRTNRSRTREERQELAKTRLVNILSRHKVALRNTLEMKISDAGPFDQRIDPLPLSEARKAMEQEGLLKRIKRAGTDWYYLTETPIAHVHARLAELEPIHAQLRKRELNTRIGQALEIAVFRSLSRQSKLAFAGDFADLHEHDDSTLYVKEEPPSSWSGKRIPRRQRLDFFAIHIEAGIAGIEIKNVREWLYIDRPEIKDLLAKCCHLDAIPVLIARRLPYVTFHVLNPCGVVLHQTYNQRYPASAAELAEQARHRNVLGYHDIRLGNEPDDRLNKFVHGNLPTILPGARERFDEYKDLLQAYAIEGMSYREFSARVRRRHAGTNEDHDWPDTP